MGAKQTIVVIITFRKSNKNSLEHPAFIGQVGKKNPYIMPNVWMTDKLLLERNWKEAVAA
jgi:hypothetical protein